MKFTSTALLLAGAHAKRLGEETVLTMVDGSMKGFVEELVQYEPREIYDADGDGVEDNVDYTHHQLDRFYKPAVFREADDIYNTQHGNLPGHRTKWNEELEPEFFPFDLAPDPTKNPYSFAVTKSG